jgi:uncharacterized NAD(P)/FAD-binding protein YdhS
LTRVRTIAVIGGGFSGLLTAIHLLHGDPGVVVRLVEKAPQFARGRAFEAGPGDHLLNVRVANMSAFPDRPAHFQDWLAARGVSPGSDAFVSRALYGDYLQAILREAVVDPGGAGRLLLEHDEAIAVRPRGATFQIDLALGRDFQADAVVIAVGLGPPARPPGVSAEALGRLDYVADPWRGDLDALPQGDVLLLGSGLTMIDVALAMHSPGRNLLAVSRRGLLPRVHGPAPPAPPPSAPLGTPRQVLAALRAHARAVGWRSAVDSIRPATPDLWRRWNEAERRAFLRHLQPWWDVHRHRVSPAVAAQLAAPVWRERFAVLAGRIEALDPADKGFRATIRLRGRRRPVARSFQAVVNCTGLSGDLTTSRLLADLKAHGLARADALNLGLDVDEACRLIGPADGPVPGLFAVGPLTRGAFWEAVAVPDLRNQTARVARAVLAMLRPTQVTGGRA